MFDQRSTAILKFRGCQLCFLCRVPRWMARFSCAWRWPSKLVCLQKRSRRSTPGLSRRYDRPRHRPRSRSVPNRGGSGRLDRDHAASELEWRQGPFGKITKRGNKQLRTLLIVGATSILKQARRGVKVPALRWRARRSVPRPKTTHAVKAPRYGRM